MKEKKVFEFRLEGFESKMRTVSKKGNSGSIYLPKDWRGKKVLVIALEPTNEDSENEEVE